MYAVMPITFLVNPECTERKPDVPSMPNEFLTLSQKIPCAYGTPVPSVRDVPTGCQVNAECMRSACRMYVVNTYRMPRLPRGISRHALRIHSAHSASSMYAVDNIERIPPGMHPGYTWHGLHALGKRLDQSRTIGNCMTCWPWSIMTCMRFWGTSPAGTVFTSALVGPGNSNYPTCSNQPCLDSHCALYTSSFRQEIGDAYELESWKIERHCQKCSQLQLLEGCSKF